MTDVNAVEHEIEEEKAKQEAAAAKAVSYTHLDVYKRQALKLALSQLYNA